MCGSVRPIRLLPAVPADEAVDFGYYQTKAGPGLAQGGNPSTENIPKEVAATLLANSAPRGEKAQGHRILAQGIAYCYRSFV